MSPVDTHVAELERALRGPAKARRSMVREARDGLDDAADAYRRGGMDPHAAARQAVRDFGPVAEIAPQYQDELVADQGRRTALLLAVTLPSLMLGWDLVWASGLGGRAPAPAAIVALARVQEYTSGLVGLLALALVALTFRRTRSPRRVAAAAAATALVAIAVCGGTAVAMSVINYAEAWQHLGARPLVAIAAYLVSFGVLVLLNRSALHTLRTLRPHRRPRWIGPSRTTLWDRLGRS